MLTLCTYTPDKMKEWNCLISESRNATFLLDRNFMDYHSDRFIDASLMFYNTKGHPVAVLPANYEQESQSVYSHHGLTYGGLIVTNNITTLAIGEAIHMACQHYASMGAKKLYYRPTPYIYNKYPSQEDLYYLFRNNAQLEGRMLSQTIYIPEAIRMNELRRRCIKKSLNCGNRISEEKDVTEFWHILNTNLQELHNVKPVHSIDEIHLLMSRFPEQIRHFVVRNQESTVIAGTIIFDCGNVVHTQYISANKEGKQTGAFDQLVSHLLTTTYAERKYFDFGVSTENGGYIINEGLTFQKESFGGRGVCYDTWSLNLSKFQ